jgi:hypothetical protein
MVERAMFPPFSVQVVQSMLKTVKSGSETKSSETFPAKELQNEIQQNEP